MLVKKFLRSDVTVDLGTANTVIALGQETNWVQEPTVLAYKLVGVAGTVEAVATGHAAKLLLGRAPEGITVSRPIRQGIVDNFSLTQVLLKAYADRIIPKGVFRKSTRLAMLVPCQANQVDRRVLREAALSLGVGEVYLIEKPLASAVGAGLPVHDGLGCMVVDVGAGLTEVGILSLGGPVCQMAVPAAGDHMEALIIQHVRKAHGLLLGEQTAERVKLALASALPPSTALTLEVTGQKLSEGAPRSVTLTAQEIFEAISESVETIVTTVQECLAQSPPELSAGLSERGITLCGQGSQLNGLGTLLAQKTSLPIWYARDPGTCAARGAAQLLSQSSRAPALALQEE